DVERAPAAEEYQDQGQRNGGLARGHRDDEQRERLALQVTAVPGKGDEIHGHALQHHLRAKEHDDQVAPRQKANEAQREEDRADDQVIWQGNGVHGVRSSRRLAMAMAPMVATSSSVPPNSTASR